MKKYLFFSVSALLLIACENEFLEKKPDKKIVVPSTLVDVQALLDNTDMMNINMPSLQEIASDDYYVTTEQFNSVTTARFRNAYIWAAEIYEGDPEIIDWHWRYRQIFYANLCIETLDAMDAAKKESQEWAHLKGAAYFYRAWGHFCLSQLFCLPYRAPSATQDLGLSLKTSSDINIVKKRSSVADTYKLIVNDLENSVSLLPAEVQFKTRPSKTAAYAMLSRVYLSMADYQKAGDYAGLALANTPGLLDYSTLNTEAQYPFERFNEEVIFHSTMLNTAIMNASRLIIDSVLYETFLPGDLRIGLFFRQDGPYTSYKGSYGGGSQFFNGLAADELMLTHAECMVRRGEWKQGIHLLNGLLATRFKKGTFTPSMAESGSEAMSLVLLERRKQLLFRGMRWIDLRRLNSEPDRAVTLTRKIGGSTYTLPPNDRRYVFPLPDLVVQLSGLDQNVR